jgi:cytochrome b6-f complex iron-sulfur subunit
MDRRAFLHRLERTALGACIALPVIAGACASVQYVPGDLRDGLVYVPLARLAADGTALVEVPGMDLPLFVRRVASSEAIALSTRCKHRGCQVDPEVDRLVCPCHGSEYALDGAVLKGPTQRPLDRFAVRESGDSLVIELGGRGVS